MIEFSEIDSQIGPKFKTAVAITTATGFCALAAHFSHATSTRTFLAVFLRKIQQCMKTIVNIQNHTQSFQFLGPLSILKNAKC